MEGQSQQNLQDMLYERYDEMVAKRDEIKAPEYKNIEYYISDSPSLLQDKYQMFNEWCDKQGIHMPKLQYPAYFEGGLIGARVTEEIAHREAFLYVPYKVLITLGKATSHPVLGRIMAHNPQCFEEGKNDDWEQFSLALFLFYEIAQGEKSFWFPYLRTMPTVEFTSFWPQKDLASAQDPGFHESLLEYKMELEMEWQMFEKVLNQYPKIFPKKIVDRGLFMNIYGQVCTRCFGYGLPTCSMIPMADNVNHSSVDITNEVIHLEKHINGDQDPEYYRRGKFMNNYKEIYSKAKKPIGERTLNVEGRMLPEKFEENEALLSLDSIRKGMETKQIWEIPYFHDAYNEDNDSDEDEDEEKKEEEDKSDRKKRRTLLLSKRRALEFFIIKEKQFLKRQEEKRKRMQQEVDNASESTEPNTPKEKRYCKPSQLQPGNELVYDEDKLTRSEYILPTKNDKIREIDEKWIKEGEDDESEEEFEWLEEVCLKDQLPSNLEKQIKYLDSFEQNILHQEFESEVAEFSEELDEKRREVQEQTFFSLINTMRKAMPKGSQAWNSYGNRTNSYLLVNYGFAFENNLYDSYAFNVRMDLDLTVEQDVTNLVAHPDQEENVQMIKLKKNQLNEVLIGYIRQIKKEVFFGKGNSMLNQILLSQVRDLEFELHCVKVYLRLMNYLLFRTEDNYTSLSEDLELKKKYQERLQEEANSSSKPFASHDEEEKDPVSFKFYMGLVYRIEKKIIIRSQIEICLYMISVLSLALKLRGLLDEDKIALANLVPEFKNGYMRAFKPYMPGSEEEHIEEWMKDSEDRRIRPIFKASDEVSKLSGHFSEEYWFYYRRLHMRNYLKEIFNLISTS